MNTTKTHKILIVDDDPDDTDITKRVLSKAGFKILVGVVESGEAALELLQKEDDLPSLILLDLKMPGMSGIDTLRLIRSDRRLKSIPVIIATNSNLESDRNASYAAGADGFIQKDFDIGKFGRDIKSILERWLKQ